MINSIFCSYNIVSYILILISSLVILLYSKVTIKFSSSNKVSTVFSFKSFNIVISHSKIFILN
jgi:hypothetical protein